MDSGCDDIIHCSPCQLSEIEIRLYRRHAKRSSWLLRDWSVHCIQQNASVSVRATREVVSAEPFP